MPHFNNQRPLDRPATHYDAAGSMTDDRGVTTSDFLAKDASQLHVQSELNRSAPAAPGMEAIFNWNRRFILFSWETVRCAEEGDFEA